MTEFMACPDCGGVFGEFDDTGDRPACSCPKMQNHSGMEVYVPFTRINKTQMGVFAMENIGPHWMPMVDDEAYWRLLSDQWRKGGKFLVVEHDILPWPGALRELWDCPEPWCSMPYYLQSGIGYAFGCTKFDPARMPEMAEALTVVDRYWYNLDTSLISYVRDTFGVKVHHHPGPPVIHVNQEHAPFVVRETENENSWSKRRARQQAG